LKLEFATVARELEHTAAKLKQAAVPQLRRKLLAQMRLLLAQADQLAFEEAPAT
jgi:hypothetical protein